MKMKNSLENMLDYNQNVMWEIYWLHGNTENIVISRRAAIQIREFLVVKLALSIPLSFE